MAKKMRRTIAMILALAMCAPQMAIQSAANETAEQPQPVINITVDSSETSVTQNEDGGSTTTTETTKETEMENADGTMTTEKESSSEETTTDKNGDVVSEKESQSSESSTENSEGDVLENNKSEESKEVTYGENQQNIEKEWSESENKNPEPVENKVDENTTVTNTSESSSKTEGSESGVITNTPHADGSETVSGTYEGSESSESSSTETSSEVKTDVNQKNLSDVVDSPVTTPDPSASSSVTDVTPDNAKESDWEKGNLPNDEDIDWNRQGTEEGTPVEQQDKAKTEDLGTASPELDDPNVTLENMTPGGESVQATRGYTAEEMEKSIKAGEQPAIHDPSKEEEGYTYSYEFETDKYGHVTKVTVSRSKEIEESIKDMEQNGEIKVVDGNSTVDEGVFVEDPAMEALVKADPVEVPNEDGTVTKTYYQHVLDSNNNVVGYRKVVDTITVEAPTTTKENIEGKLEEELKDDLASIDTYDNEEKKWLELPDKNNLPAEVTDRDNGDGTFTTIKVTEIKATTDNEFTKAGDVVGYRVETQIYTKEGDYVRNESEEVYGTAFTETKTTTTDPNTLQTITTNTKTEREIDESLKKEFTRKVEANLTKELVSETTILSDDKIWQLLETENGPIFIYEGKMYKVEGTATLGNKFNVTNGDNVKLSGFDLDKSDLRIEGEEILGEDGTVKKVDNGHHTGSFLGEKGSYSTWTQVGFGQYSDFLAREGENATGSPHGMKQYMMKKGNETMYVYCIELGVTDTVDASYSYASDLYKNDQSVVPWTGAQGTVGQLGIVLMNGYNGTESGMGSLQAVKDLMIRQGYADEAALLTEGKALAGTQLALWNFARTSNRGFSNDPITYDDEIGKEPDADEKKIIYAVRDMLINLANDKNNFNANGSAIVNAIGPEHITGASIVLKSKEKDTNGEDVQDSKGNDIYNSDIIFGLDVSTSSINGDIVLKVTDENGRVIGNYRLAGQDDKSIYKGEFTRISPDSNGNYTLSNVKLAENVKVTLNLEGVQDLADGVYIFKNSGTQDFIGLSRQVNEFNLSVSMDFSVTEPVYEGRNEHKEEKRNDTITFTAQVERVDTLKSETQNHREEEINQETHQRAILATVTKVESLKEETKSLKVWDEFAEYTLVPINDEDGGEEDEEEKDPDDKPKKKPEELTTILDEEVPLSAGPRTGDPSLALALITLAAFSGAALMLKKDEE